MKKFFILKFVLVCISLCISLNARTQTRASLPSSFTETPAPTGEVRFPAEFEPVQAVIIAHMEGDNLPVRFIKEMAEDCKVITIVDQNTYTDDSSVRTIYTDGGVDLNNCEFVMAPLDGRWTRDYSPWIVFNGTTPAIVDNIYNRVYTGTNDKSQINDDNISNVLYNKWKTEYPNLELYGMDVVHTGGNMMQDGYGNGVSDDIVYSESYKYLGLSEDEVDQKMKDYLGIDPYHVTIDPQGDYVAHVDCWGKFLAPDKILLAKVHQNHPRAKEYKQVANYFENTNCCWGYPYKVHYVELPDGVEENTTVLAPYTNSLILNKKVFVPLDSKVGGTYNADAIALYESLMPGYEIIPFECTNNDLNNWYGWRNTDALHCRTHEVMDFNMLFVDHRDVLWGKQENQASYSISAKFIAYSGDAITETKLHYSTDNGSTYTTVDMQQVGTTNEYTADIPGNHQEGTVIKYYITGKDASGRECVQPTFGEYEPHAFEVGTPEAIQPSTEAITLTADKTTITANGTDAITFTAMQGTTDITLLAEYYIGEEKIRSPYKTTTSGTYEVYAKYNGIESNKISITVEAMPVLADNIVQIDGVDKTTNKYIPAYCAQKWAITQQIYTAAEIGKTGTIDKIAFKTADVDTESEKYPFTRNLEIYMIETTASDFGTTNTMIAMPSTSKVFSKNVEFSSKDSWISIDITDFEYKGENLLICVNDVTGSNVSGGITFDVISCTTNRSLYKRPATGATTAFDATTAITAATLNKQVPFLQLTFKTDSTPEPTPTPDPLVITANNTTFTANGTDAVTFSVTQGGNAVNDATIYVDGVAQAGYTFSTTTAKEYTVYAQKGDLTSDEITITAEAPAVIKPVIDLTKYYRIKVNSGTYANQYLHISNTANTVITSAKADDQAQIFKIEDAGNGNYYLKSANGLYIKCDAASGAWWNIYGNATNKTPLLFEYTNETEFYIRDYDKITGTSATNDSNSANSYFKVENGTVYCDAPTTNTDVVTWTLEEVPLSVTISADNNTVTVNESVQLNATAIGGTGNYTYSWSPATGLDDATIAKPTFTPTATGTYEISCTVTSGTESVTSSTIAITVKEAPQGGGTEEVVTIDGSKTGNGTTANNIPIYAYDKVSISQQYYTQHEIGRNNGTITKIAFKTTNDIPEAYPYDRSIEIYMRNTDSAADSLFAKDARTMIQLSSENKLFSGTVTFKANSWVTIELDTPFPYNGNNILVCVNDITKSYIIYKPSFETFEYSTDKGYKAKRVNKTSNTAYNPTTTINVTGGSANVPCIQFTFASNTTPEPTPEPITITANPSEVTVGENISFTVMQGSTDVTSSATLSIGTDEITNPYTTTEAGTFTVHAEIDGQTAETTITVLEPEPTPDPLILKANKTTLTADGIDVVTFTVTQGGNAVNDATIYVDGTAQAGYTFTTTTARTYTVYAQKGDLTSNEITINAEIALDPTIIDGVYYYPDGRVTYNIGTDRQYTLIVGTDPTKPDYGAIKQDNVYIYGDGNNITYEPKNDNKPQAPTTLILPDKVLSGTEWITVTKVEAYAFDDLFEDGVEPGNELNALFTNLVIPSTIQEISTYTFGFSMGQGSSIICYAKTPPTLADDCTNNPFISTTYNNSILYVPAESVEAYKAAEGWGTPRKQGGYYFKNIYPITIPTYVGDGDWKNNANNWRTYVKNNDETYIEQYGVMPNAGEDVLIDGNVTIPEGYVANAGNINIISGSITIADGGQLIHTNAGLTVTMEKKITGYVSSTSPTSWYTISSPLYPSVKAKDVNGLLSNDYDLYRYDEPTHYWDNIEDLEDLEGPQGNWETLDAGRGYLYANSGDVTLQFNGVANHTSASYTLTRGTEDGKLEGFHLVGNPFTHNIYMSSAFETDVTLADGYYALTNEGAWGAKLSTDEPIKPCQGILIQATEGEGTLTINKKVDPAPQTRSRSNNEFVAISIANNKYEDVAYVSFDVENPLEKVNHQNKNIPMVYIPAEDINYSIATIENDVEEIPVAFEAKTMGQYTIGAKSQNCEFEEMYLLDKMTGIKTNLLLESYTFMATTTDNPERFVIKLNKNANDLDNGNFIFINNNEMIINNIEGRASLQIFDVMGRYLCNYEVTGSANISTEEFSSGVYIIRLMDNNGVKTQKVVL